MMNDQIRMAQQTFEGIINRRLAKITDLAAIVADGANGSMITSNEHRMTPEEREAYDGLVYSLRRVRTKMISGCGGELHGESQKATTG